MARDKRASENKVKEFILQIPDQGPIVDSQVNILLFLGDLLIWRVPMHQLQTEMKGHLAGNRLDLAYGACRDRLFTAAKLLIRQHGLSFLESRHEIRLELENFKALEQQLPSHEITL